eukprot:scaffold32519_cov114-Isochrysis_galbana.AAC.1
MPNMPCPVALSMQWKTEVAGSSRYCQPSSTIMDMSATITVGSSTTRNLRTESIYARMLSPGRPSPLWNSACCASHLAATSATKASRAPGVPSTKGWLSARPRMALPMAGPSILTTASKKDFEDEKMRWLKEAANPASSSTMCGTVADGLPITSQRCNRAHGRMRSTRISTLPG